MSTTAFFGAVELGFIYAIFTFGIFISFRILNIPDLTTDGSFVLGAAASALCVLNGMPYLGIPASMLVGAAAGIVTALLQTKCGIQPILSGILTMTGLYSINLAVMMNKSNLPLLMMRNIFTPIEENIISRPGFRLILLIPLTLIILLILVFFFKTQLGLSIRATGDNAEMVRASSIDTDTAKIVGFALSNSLIGLGGGLVAQLQQSVDINMGAGMVVVGLASLIIGEMLIKSTSVLRGLIGAVAGAVAYRLVIAAILTTNLPASSLKLISALIVAIAIAAPTFRKKLLLREQIRRNGADHA